MKLESCNFVMTIYRWTDRRRHAGGTAVGGESDCGGEGVVRVTAIGGGGGAAAAARVTGCRGWGSGACVGETSSSARTEFKSANFLATASAVPLVI